MRGLNAGLGAVLVATVVAGCGGGADDARKGQSTPNAPAEQPPPGTPQKPERKSFDPPRVFEKTGATFSIKAFSRDETPTVTLHDGTIYGIDGKAVLALDGITGEQLWSAPSTIGKGTAIGEAPPVPFAAKDRVYAAFAGAKPAQGTAPAVPQIEVLAIDAKSGKVEWNTVFDVGVQHGESGGAGGGVPAVVGVTDTSVVVRYFDDTANVGLTFVLDATSHEVRWKKDKFLADEVDSGVVVGNGGKPFIGEPRTVAGFAEADGAQKWSTDLGGYGTTLMPISPKLVASNRKDYRTGDYQFDILDVATGKALVSKTTDVPTTSTYIVKCFYDDASLIVCDAAGERTFAYDVNNVGATPLWEITKSADRVVPSVVSAYHGMVYGYGAKDPVALDGKTGQDAPDTPGVAPELVDRYLAVDIRKNVTYQPIK